jgi:hypothetical protein
MLSSSNLEQAIVIAVLAYLFVLVTRWIARWSWVSHWAWLASRPRPLGTPRRKVFGGPRRRPLQWIKRRAAAVVVRYAGQPLLVKAFEGAKGKDTAAVSAALSSAMTRIASVRRSGVDSVTAPIAAETTTETIADAVKAAPAGGELAAALLRLGSVLLARGALQLDGHVLPPSVGGPGLALTLAKGKGRVIERLTLRAAEFEPPGGVGGSGLGDETDRLLRVVTAGAIWTHFKILEEVWKLTESELQDSLRTWSWRSYALTRIGIEGEERQGPDVTRALYAKAVEVDRGNLVAQFNLASLESSDRLLALVPGVGAKRLELVHDGLEREYKEAKVESGGGSEVQEEQLLLAHDPLCYQVSYKRIAFKVNKDVALEAEHEAAAKGELPGYLPLGRWRPGASRSGREPDAIGGLSVKPVDLEELTSHLRDLESTLELLERARYGWWPAAVFRRWTTERSKQRAELRRLLIELEGPMLVLWAMVALRVGPSAWLSGSAAALVEPKHSPSVAKTDGPAPGTREWLVQSLDSGLLTPGEAVGFARATEMSPSSRTRLNLACWYADVNRLEDSLRQLELGMESSSEVVDEWLSDAQLRRLRADEELADELSGLEARYTPSPTRANGNHPLSSNGRPPIGHLLLRLMGPLVGDGR